MLSAPLVEQVMSFVLTSVVSHRKTKMGLGHRVAGSAILAGSGRVTGHCVRPGVRPGFEFYHARLLCRCFYRVTPSRQTNIHGFGFGSFPITALLVYLFQLVPVNIYLLTC